MRQTKKVTKLKKSTLIAIVIVLGLGLGSGDQVVDFLEELLNVVEGNQSSEYQVGEVVRVVDGDTIVVDIEGEEAKVRLIGVDTPESVGQYADDPEYFGKEASAYTKELLEGERVYLVKDTSETDRYDRLLRYVWLEEPSEDTHEMVNALLIENGYAKVTIYEPDDGYEAVFEALEETAKKEKLGLWGK